MATIPAGSLTQLYPDTGVLLNGYLPTGDGHEIYFEECGNPMGTPVVFLHGGPGSSCNANHRRYFDPRSYRVVMFDQRGCGRSRPRGDVAHNTTQHLLVDMEALREHLHIERWMLFGGSWGSTLALAYVRQHPARVTGMVLRGVFLATPPELEWYCMGLRAFVPDAWRKLTQSCQTRDWRQLVTHYEHAMRSSQAEPAARRWSDYESAVMAIGEAVTSGAAADAAALLDRVRVQLHYLTNDCFLTEPLIATASRVDVPVIIVQGRRDLVCPPCTAFELHGVIKDSEFIMVEGGGHSAMHPEMVAALVGATDVMKRRKEVMV